MLTRKQEEQLAQEFLMFLENENLNDEDFEWLLTALKYINIASTFNYE